MPPLLLFALLLAGCGGGNAVKLNANDIAVVGTEHVTLAMYQQALADERANLKASGQAFPKAGTSNYQSLQTTIVDTLVQQAELTLEAVKLGIQVTDKEVQSRIDAIKKQYFGGSEAKYLAGVKKQGFTDAAVRASIREGLLQQKIVTAVTKNAKATDAQVLAYYAQNLSQYQKPASRKVREILAGKNKQKLAEQIYTQLKAGASFAALAKKYSQDPGSKNSGGVFTAQKGADVPEFDAAVFAASAKTGVLLAPVKTAQYGWFVIQPLGPIVPATTTSEAKAAPAIRKQLDTTQEQTALSAWVQGVAKSYCTGSKILYQAGYTPSPDPCTTLTASNQTTT